MGLWSNLASLVLFMVCSVIGLLIFTRGFLLSRVAIQDRADNSPHNVMPPQYSRAVVLVVDALRYDFVQTQPGSSEYYHNRLTYTKSLLKRKPGSTRLYKFIADPPTTTMQRLKGLTTGSLPTFVDAGSNFASSEISEDNIIQQLLLANKTVVFMGDDTWESLFPNRFNRSYPFPSFNVKDLHTVDTGVKDHLLPEMRRSDWSVIIGHFLGVDHCGHRYGPDHPAMSAKLKEMDDVIRTVVENLPDDALLVILGDHGMTRTGDHGSDSALEVEAALFLHSKSADWPVPQEEHQVSQIDLVPTLSLLLGLPVPYSNLGSAIGEVFRNGSTIDALRLNYQQISSYLSHYNSISSDLPKSELARLRDLAETLASTPPNDNTRAKYQGYTRRARLMCQGVWAKFDDSLMAVGLLTVLSICAVRLAFVLGIVADKRRRADAGIALITVLALALSYLGVITTYSSLLMSLLLPLVLVVCAQPGRPSLTRADAFAFFIVALQGLASLSNSLLVNEDRVTYFLLQSALIVNWLREVTATQVEVKKQAPGAFLYRVLVQPSTAILVLLNGCLAASFFFNSCREEQTDCRPSNFLTPLASIHPDATFYKNARFFLLALPCLYLPMKVTMIILTARGNANGHAPLVMAVRYGFPAVASSLLLHWVISSTAYAEKLATWHQTVPATAVYFLVLAAVATCFLFPLAIYVSDGKRREVVFTDRSVPTLYRYVRQELSEDRKQAPPLVYGLGTAVSSNFLPLLCSLVYLFMMLGGDGMAAAQLLNFVVLLLFLDLTKMWKTTKSGNISVGILVGWTLLGKHFFFFTGHQPTMPNIRWEAAFQGFAKDHGNYAVPAVLLFVSTFSSQVLSTCALPLLLVVRDSCQYTYESLWSTAERSLTGIGEVALVQHLPSTESRLYHLYSSYLLLHLIKTFFSLLSACLLRRHLMVWKIFAPAFIYEAASFVVVCLLATLSYLLFVAVVTAMQRFLKDKELSHKE